MSLELNKTIQELGTSFEQFKIAHAAEIAALKKDGVAPADLTAKVDRALAAIEEATAMKARLEKLELDKDTPANPETKYEDAHLKVFKDWLRNPRDHQLIAKLAQAHNEDLQHKGLRHKDVQGNVAALGGSAVPEVIDRRIRENLVNESPMRQIVNVITSGTPDYKTLVDVGGESSGWVGETDTRSATNTARLEEVAPTFGTVYAYPKVTEESLNDIFFDVAGWISKMVLREFGYQEGVSLISGNGNKKPTGLLAGSFSTVDDGRLVSPQRAFGTIQYVPTGSSGAFPASTTTTGAASDCLITLQAKLRPAYKRNAKWIMNRGTRATVRKLIDKQANYLWQPGIGAGQSDTLLGDPIVIMDDMAAIAANSYSIAYGDFREAYTLVDLVGMRITLDEITTPGYVKYYVRKRLGGKLVLDEAVKVLKFAAS